MSFEYNAAAHNRPMFVINPPATTASPDSAHASAADATSDAAPSTPVNKSNKSTALLQQMLQKTLAIDAATASYYLSAADGDAKAAIAAYREDQRWDAKMKDLKRSLGSKKYAKRK